MAPNPWLTFTLFGIPFAIGLLAGLRGGRLAWRAYRRYGFRTAGVDPGDNSIVDATGPVSGRPEYSLREQAFRGVALLIVSAFLLAHSGRWLLSVYGYL